jgi:hypothetical protein
MPVLLYSALKGRRGKQLRKVIKQSLPDEKIEMYQMIISLSQRLRQPKYDLTAIVLHISSKADFLNVLSLRDLLDDLRIIFVLPEDEECLLKKVHELRPRFISYDDGDFSDVAEVLRRMTSMDYKNKFPE